MKTLALSLCNKAFGAAVASVHKAEVARRSRLGPRRAKTGGNKNEEDKKTTLQTRVGAFEVQIAFLHPKHGLMVETLHSKLVSKSWPNKELIRRRVTAFFDQVVKAHLKDDIVEKLGKQNSLVV